MLKGKNPRSYAFTPPITTLLVKPRVQLAQCAFSLGFSISFSSSTSEDAMQETQFRSLGREDPLEKRMATHSSILAWSILASPMDRGAWWATVHGVTKSQTQLSN